MVGTQEPGFRICLLGLGFLSVSRGGQALSAGVLGPSGFKEGRGERREAGRGRMGVVLAQGTQRGHVSLVGSEGRAGRHSGDGDLASEQALLCFLFNYNGPSSHKGSFCPIGLGEGGR